MLGWAGWDFRSAAADIDETPLDCGGDPVAYVRRLAGEKARTVMGDALPGEVILAADTTVADGELLLGKPADRREARSMLNHLRGRSHQVYTAIAIIDSGKGAEVTDLCVSDVPMREYSDDEMEAYIDSGDPFDKAGGYAIQHTGFAPVKHLSSCYANVMGLPLCHVVRAMRRLGYAPVADVPATCQGTLDYSCPVYQAVLEQRV